MSAPIGLYPTVCPHCTADREHPVRTNGPHNEVRCLVCGEHIRNLGKGTKLIPYTNSAEPTKLSQREQIVLRVAVERLATLDGRLQPDDIETAIDEGESFADTFLSRCKHAS